jgi:hypothetical protein
MSQHTVPISEEGLSVRGRTTQSTLFCQLSSHLLRDLAKIVRISSPGLEFRGSKTYTFSNLDF